MADLGYRTGQIFDASRLNWHDTGPRPIAWSAWYPADATHGGERPLGQPFDLGPVVKDAPLAAPQTFPVVLLSHGTGGTAESLGWVARCLASAGYVVIGANHHGNTAIEPYLPHGFLCWWERAIDLSVLLTDLGTNGVFAGRLDLDQVAAVGFSLGCHSICALAGARTSMDQFETWHRTSDAARRGPQEFPDLFDHMKDLATSSRSFQQSWARHGEDFSDPRIGALVMMAPPPPVRSLTPRSIARIEQPTTILTAGTDYEAPPEHGVTWLQGQNPGFQHQDLGQHVGHYSFLELPADKALMGIVDIFTDHPEVDRKDIHRRAAKLVRGALQ